jgi:sugar phosphate isomerase/epimerase
MMDERGVSCHELVPWRLTADLDESAAHLADVRRLAQAVGPEVVQLVVPDRPTDSMVELARRAVAEMSDIGRPVAIEFVAGYGVGCVADGLALADQLGGSIGLVVDSWQYLRAEDTWDSLEALTADDLAFVQFADGLSEPLDDVRYETVNERRIPAQGAFPLGRFADIIRRKGWDGVVSVEVLSEQWRRRDARTFATETLAATRPFWAG